MVFHRSSDKIASRREFGSKHRGAREKIEASIGRICSQPCESTRSMDYLRNIEPLPSHKLFLRRCTSLWLTIDDGGDEILSAELRSLNRWRLPSVFLLACVSSFVLNQPIT